MTSSSLKSGDLRKALALCAALSILSGVAAAQTSAQSDSDQLSARRANVFSDRADFGGKVSLSKAGGEVNSRIALIKSEVFDLAIVPSAGLALGSVTSDETLGPLVSFGIPILADIRLGDAGDLVLGAKLHAHFGTIEGENSNPSDGTGTTTDGTGNNNETPLGSFVLYPGWVVGLNLELSDNFAIMPEINVLFPYDPEENRFAKPIFQGGIGFTFGI